MNDRVQGLTTADIAGSGSSDVTRAADREEKDLGRGEETSIEQDNIRRAIARTHRI